MRHPREKYIGVIKARMEIERAIDLSDLEIERTLGDCVGGINLIKLAKELRDLGFMGELYE